MTDLYVITDREGKGLDRFQWQQGVITWATYGRDADSGEYWSHAVTDYWLAVFAMPALVNDVPSPRIWQAEGDRVRTDGFIAACRKLRAIREKSIPRVTIEQRIRFAISCLMPTNPTPRFAVWARRWLKGKDRTSATASAASEAIRRPFETPERSCLEAARWAVDEDSLSRTGGDTFGDYLAASAILAITRSYRFNSYSCASSALGWRVAGEYEGIQWVSPAADDSHPSPPPATQAAGSGAVGVGDGSFMN